MNFFTAQIQIPVPIKYLGKGTRCTKTGAHSLAENIPNALEFIYPVCLVKLKSSGFQLKKVSLGVRIPCQCMGIDCRVLLGQTSSVYLLQVK